MILFFFPFNISNASISKSGDITTSQNKELIDSAESESILEFEIKIPPNAETGSAANALSYASLTLFLTEIPQALLCFKIANVGLSSLNSDIKSIAASTSNKLL